MAEKRICSVDGCGKPARSRGRCMPHYRAAAKRGDIIVKPLTETRLQYIHRVVLNYKGDACFFWPFLTSNRHRPCMYFRGRIIGVSRAVCMLAHGEPERPDMEAAHSCAKGHLGCVNPAHLRWATKIENLAERGQLVGRRIVLSAPIAREIRASVTSVVELAERYGVTVRTVSRIRNGHSWKNA